MFFRESYSKKSPAPILQLVESKRASGSTSHQLIVSLGRMDIDKTIRRSVADRVEAILTGQESLLTTPDDIEKHAQNIVKKIRVEGKWINARRVAKVDTPDATTAEVFIDQIEHTNSCELGPVLTAYTFWQRLRFSDVLNDCSFSDIEIKTAAASIMSRLIHPQSENNIPVWINTTALPEVMTIHPEKISKNRYYRVSDKLLQNKDKIEKKLADHETELFKLERNIYLYDLTNTYFEGEQKENNKAKYSGKSKEKRNDCPQVAVGLVVDEKGFPIRHKLFDGNTHDSDTLLGVVNELKKDIGKNTPTIIVDSGMSKDEHLNAIREAGFHYVVTQKRSKRANYPEIFGKDNLFTAVPGRDKKPPVQVYKKEYDDHALLFCKSEGRKNKETAIKDNAHLRFTEDLNKLAKRIKKGQLKDSGKIQQAIGRLKERHHRVSRFYELSVIEKEQQTLLEWQHINELSEDIFDGCYIMKTSKKELSDKEIWSLYMTLLKVERGFRNLKSNLGLRPNFHWKEARVDGHIFITILAYHLLHAIEYSLQEEGDFRTWPTIKQLLETHCYTTMIMPTVKGPVINLRKAGLPDAEQKEIYRKLRVDYNGLPIKKVVA